MRANESYRQASCAPNSSGRMTDERLSGTAGQRDIDGPAGRNASALRLITAGHHGTKRPAAHRKRREHRRHQKSHDIDEA